MGYLDFWGKVVPLHPSEGSLSSRLMLPDRAGEWREAVYSAGNRFQVRNKIGKEAHANEYGTETVDE